MPPQYRNRYARSTRYRRARGRYIGYRRRSSFAQSRYRRAAPYARSRRGLYARRRYIGRMRR